MEKPSFDELKDLAKRDPEGFERLRSELIENCIRQSSSCNQRRLRGLQFVIEARRLMADNPMKALLDIQMMMHESFIRLQQALLAHQSSSHQSCSEPSAPITGQVLRFRRSPLSVDGVKVGH